ADTETDPRFCSRNGVFELLDEQVHVVSPPIGALSGRKALGCSVRIEAVIIGERGSGNGIGIKIIIHMDGIHIVPGNDISNHLANKAPVLRQPGIKKKLISILEKSLGILPV